MTSHDDEEGSSSGLKIFTWNVNGIRSFEDFPERLQNIDADIICIQETKVTRDMLTEAMAIIPGFTSYFSFSRLRSGYSGVATFCRMSVTPIAAESSLAGTGGTSTIGPGASCLREEFTSEELRSLDTEGRCVVTRHRLGDQRHLVIINVYCPRADPEKLDRVRYKQMFNKALDIRANRLKEAGDMVVVCGDINISHREIDHCDPYDGFEDNPGRRFLNHFLKHNTDTEPLNHSNPENNDNDDHIEEWMTGNVSIQSRQFVDTFRIFHPDRKQAFTCWNTEMNCRSTNYGTRIDYIFASLNMSSVILDCDIQPEVLGSDHCPVLAMFNITVKPSDKPPESCTKYFKEFSGKQVKLSNFFIKTDKRSIPEDRSVAASPMKKRKLDGKAKITSFFTSKNPKLPSTVICDKKNVIEVISPAETNADKPSQIVANNKTAKAAWGSLLRGPAPAPLCPRHQEEALRRKVTKKGPNTGREFWCCRRGEGRADDPEARCDFFKWLK